MFSFAELGAKVDAAVKQVTERAAPVVTEVLEGAATSMHKAAEWLEGHAR